LRQPNRLGALLPFDSGENAINPNAGILKISKQISDRYPFAINTDPTELHFTLNQNIGKHLINQNQEIIFSGKSLRTGYRLMDLESIITRILNLYEGNG
jgi:hypothetical protein